MNMDVPWNVAQFPKPALMSQKKTREQLSQLAACAFCNKPEEWVHDVHSTLTRLARAVTQPHITKQLAIESAFLDATLNQMHSMRSEKFYQKLRQLSRCTIKYLESGCSKLVRDVSELMPAYQPAVAMKEHRLPSATLLRHTLLHLLRGHATLARCVAYAEDAAVWLEFKIKLKQRTGLAMALYAVASRLRAISLYLCNSMEPNYSKLQRLLPGVLQRHTSESIVQDLPLHLPGVYEETNTSNVDVPKFLRNLLSGVSRKMKRKEHTMNTAPKHSSVVEHTTNTAPNSSVVTSSTAGSVDGVTKMSSTASMFGVDDDFGEVISREEYDAEIVKKNKKTKKKIKKSFSLSKKNVKLEGEEEEEVMSNCSNSSKKRKINQTSTADDVIDGNENNNNDNNSNKKLKLSKQARGSLCPTPDDGGHSKLNLKNKLKSVGDEVTDLKINLKKKKKSLMKSCSQLNLPQLLQDKISLNSDNSSKSSVSYGDGALKTNKYKTITKKKKKKVMKVVVE